MIYDVTQMSEKGKLSKIKHVDIDEPSFLYFC